MFPLPGRSDRPESILGASGQNALFGCLYGGSLSPIPAQEEVFVALHDRVDFSIKRLIELTEPMTGNTACEQTF